MPDKSSYNKFEKFPYLAINCVNYLLENDELIWKLLYYQDANAWKDDANHPNLTMTQKRSLIYGGEPNLTDFRVFTDLGQDTAWTEEVCVLRIAPLDLVPTNYIYGSVVMGFEVFAHYRMNTLSDHRDRISVVTQKLIEHFNGQEIEGLGVLYFDAMAHPRLKSILTGNTPFKGRATVMANWLST